MRLIPSPLGRSSLEHGEIRSRQTVRQTIPFELLGFNQASEPTWMRNLDSNGRSQKQPVLAALFQGLRGLDWIQCTGGRQTGEGAPAKICCMFPLNYENLADQENLADFRIPKNTEEYLRSVGCSSFEGTCSSVCVCARARACSACLVDRSQPPVSREPKTAPALHLGCTRFGESIEFLALLHHPTPSYTIQQICLEIPKDTDSQ